MRIAHIYPIEDSWRMSRQPYNMLLTHLAMKYPEYRELAFELSKTTYTILDNSLIENSGEAIDLATVCNVAELIKAHEIILPDVFQDGPATVEKAKESVKYLKKRYPKGTPFKLQAVVHGKTDKEVAQCFTELSAMPEIDVLGIPKILAKNHPNGRPHYEHLWLNSSDEKEIHLLGLYYSFSELSAYKFPKKIRSVDTCHLAFLRIHFMNLYDVRPEGFTVDLEHDELPMTHNVKGLRRFECSIR